MRLDNLTFKGGLHIPDNKVNTKGKVIEKTNEPKNVYISLHQGTGVACKPLVKVGDHVKVGQKVGDSDVYLSTPVHSSVSGTVKDIIVMHTTNGAKSTCIHIENDGLNEIHESIKPWGDLEGFKVEEIIGMVREAGIVGLGGAAYPTHAKLNSANECTIDTLLINGAECEPYITADHRVMLEKTEEFVFGIKAMMKVLNVENCYIGIEDNKKDAIDHLRNYIKEDGIHVASVNTKFPQGDSARLVNSVLGRVVPLEGRCNNAGVVVNNVCTVLAVADALLEGKPLYERVITVTGSGIKEPKNLLVKIGTTIGDIIDQCGGFNGKPGKIIAGGPMTGMAQYSLDTPIVKATNGIIVLTEEEARPEKVLPCIKCGKCIEVCPSGLEPLFISAYALKNNEDKALEYHSTACIECGSCSYTCPSKRPLTESIKHINKLIKTKKKKKS